MKRAFTLVELLVVIGIMGLLGTAAVGGYRQMQRGMEERGVVQNVTVFVRSAYERARIDRQPTAILFWNECIREQTEDENEIVVGRAVAVRRYGRITGVQGNKLLDEFNDLNLAYPDDTVTEDEGADGEYAQSGKYSTKRIYQLDSVANGLKYSVIRDQVTVETRTEHFLTHSPFDDTAQSSGDDEAGKMKIYAFVKESAGTADWKVGSAYGFEFANIQLPHGYVFGSSFSRSTQNPVTEVKTMLFKPAGPEGSCQIDIYALRPNNGGTLTAEKIGTNGKPDDQQN